MSEKIDSAVKLVNEAIMAEYKRLEEIAKTEEGDPILIEGETEAKDLFKRVQRV